ncbi:hypothetical protein GT347_26620 [Xylophilus rhododendri]|uniref:Uncharacterized protein n=1 Tax=Xylophilus rhododendri TaxID=2697032 RepID=A0A857JDQ1_9BURK|nr:hypothetical protein [Xylophilus rhododendri]QHJ01250.1 hypothetical protein GT347_26620 [Xylophilus rhododendri]
MKNFAKPILHARRLLLVSAAASLALANLAQAKPQFQSLTIDYETSGIATVGQPYPVTIVFSHVASTPPVKVSFSADQGLRLGNAGPRTLQPGKSAITVTAIPSANGLMYVNVFTRQGTAGTANSVPVQVGPAAPVKQTDGAAKSGFGSRGIKEMPIR